MRTRLAILRSLVLILTSALVLGTNSIAKLVESGGGGVDQPEVLIDQKPQTDGDESQVKDKGIRVFPLPKFGKPPYVVEGQILVRFKEELLPANKIFKKENIPEKKGRLEERQTVRQNRLKSLEERRKALEQLSNQLEQGFISSKIKIKAIPALTLPFAGIQTFKVIPKDAVMDAIKLIHKSPLVKNVVRSAKVYPLAHNSPPPNDKLWLTHKDGELNWSKLWGMEKIGMKEAWTDTRGDDILIAVIDSGIDSAHPDLAANITSGGANFSHFLTPPWVDQDDPNQCKDAQPPDVMRDELGHGTMMAGILAAVGDNNLIGNTETSMVGVNWSARLMPLKIWCIQKGNTDEFFPNLASSIPITALAIEHAIQHDVDIINCSFAMASCPAVMEHPETPCTPQELADYAELAIPLLEEIQITQSAEILMVVGAGNNGTDNDSPNTPTYPAKYGHPVFSLENLIVVAASEKTDARWMWSNYGSQDSVHIAAPGFDIYSTTSPTASGNIDGLYIGLANGTSMATPFVGGCAALLQAMRLATSSPVLSPQELKTILINSGDQPKVGGNNSIEGVLQGRRLNCHEALHRLPVCSDCTPPSPPTGLRVIP